MKRKIIVIFALLFSFQAFSNVTCNNNIDEQPDVCVTAKVAATAMGKGFNLGQMFENEQHEPTLASAKPKIDAYYARGFRNVRIPVTWTEQLHGDYLADPKTGNLKVENRRFNSLLAVIDYALNKTDMFVVINAHHEKALKEEANADLLASLWHEISLTFKNRNYRLIYEILNEPHLKDKSAMKPSDLRNMTQKAYQNIRKNDRQRIIVIGGNQWFAAAEMANTWPDITQVGGGLDSFVMATFHHYKPWAFNGNHQGDFMDNWTEQDISTSMNIMQDWSDNIANGMPVYIGEWGTGWQSELKVMDCNNIRLWYSKFVSQFASKYEMPTAVWDDGGWFGIFDHEKGEFDNNLVDCIDGKCSWTSNQRFNSGCLLPNAN